MKKGRAGFRVEITVAPAEADRVGEALLRHSTTGGFRRQRAERVTLARREVEVTTADGEAIRVKVLEAPDGLTGASMYLYEASVTGTETALLAAASARGLTEIRHAAAEPHLSLIHI